MFRSVLLPLDGSELAEQVIDGVRPLLDADGVTMHVQTVMPLTDNAHAPAAAAKAYVDRVRERFQGWRSRVETHVDSGIAAEQILTRAVEVKADLIVLSDHGTGGVGRWLLGSHAAKIANLSPVPVYLHRVAVKENRPATFENRITLPLDGTKESEDAFAETAQLARVFGCTVDLVRVGLPLQWSLSSVPTVGENRKEIEEYLTAAAGRLAGLGVKVQAVYRQGDPATEVLAQADETRARFLVLVPRTASAMAQVLLGSVARRVVEHSHADLLLVPPRAKREKRITRIMKSPVPPA